MTAKQQHVVLVGFGNMGRALVAGWLAAAAPGRRITVIDSNPEALAHAQTLGLTAADSPEALPGPIDIAVLAVKPAQIEGALRALPPASLYISIAAGKTLGALSRYAGKDAVIIRAMPNTPAAIGLGVTGLCASENASRADRETAAGLLAGVGTIEWLTSESDMDALTAVSGSGPAYVFLLIECLTAAGIEAGLEPGLAARLATATVRGSGVYALESGSDAASLRRQVTSPRGTTEAALAVLQDGDALKRLISAAVQAATQRSRELSADQT